MLKLYLNHAKINVTTYYHLTTYCHLTGLTNRTQQASLIPQEIKIKTIKLIQKEY